jgi:hypothetical protein
VYFLQFLLLIYIILLLGSLDSGLRILETMRVSNQPYAPSSSSEERPRAKRPNCRLNSKEFELHAKSKKSRSSGLNNLGIVADSQVLGETPKGEIL